MVFTLRPSAHLPCLATRAALGTISGSSDIARFVQGGVVKTFRWATQMHVSQLTPSNFNEFANATPVAIVLYSHPSDSQPDELRERLASVADSFHTGIRFGYVDLSVDANAQMASEHDADLTPMLTYYHCGNVIDSDVVGMTNIMRELTRDRLLAWFGKARSGATLIE